MKYEIENTVRINQKIDGFHENEKVKIIDIEDGEYLIQEIDLFGDTLAKAYVDESLLIINEESENGVPKCDCKHSGSCRYEKVIAGSRQICRHIG
jgi:hypothetical protein